MYIIVTNDEEMLKKARENGDINFKIPNNIKNTDIEKENANNILLTNFLTELGIPAHLKGFKYLKYLFNYCLGNPEFEYSPITTVIYPNCAKQFNTTPLRVERAMRHGIEVGFNSEIGNKKFIEIFGDISKKPVNSHFIIQSVLYIKEHLI